MNRATVIPKYENRNSNELGCDSQDDFFKFLEEARKHANDVKLESSRLPSKRVEKTIEADDGKNKKSWKRFLLFWRKFENNSSNQQENITAKTKTLNGSYAARPKHVFSGPVPARKERSSPRRSTSGPLASCFTPTRAAETEAPYMCLDQRKLRPFGPIYRVT